MTKSIKPPARRTRQQSRPLPKPNGSHTNGQCDDSSADELGTLKPNGSSSSLTRDDLLHAMNTSITNAAPAIVEKIIKHAEEHASYLHAKFLFDFAGLNAAPTSNSAEHSLAALLLRALGFEQEITPPAPACDSNNAQASTMHD